MSSKRRIWLTTMSRACCVRSGMSSRRASSTSTAAARAVIGERSSWLTSEAKRASRSIRVCTASAISLNEPANRSRSGSDSGASRVSSPPEAMSSAASATWLSGRSSRRLVARPNRVASSRVPAAPSVSAVRIEVNVLSVDRSGNASKYPVSCSAMATPTVMNSSPSIDDELDCRSTGPHRVDQAAGELGERVRQIGAGPRPPGRKRARQNRPPRCAGRSR